MEAPLNSLLAKLTSNCCKSPYHILILFSQAWFRRAILDIKGKKTEIQLVKETDVSKMYENQSNSVKMTVLTPSSSKISTRYRHIEIKKQPITVRERPPCDRSFQSSPFTIHAVSSLSCSSERNLRARQLEENCFLKFPLGLLPCSMRLAASPLVVRAHSNN